MEQNAQLIQLMLQLDLNNEDDLSIDNSRL